jgi:hypothetical protein
MPNISVRAANLGAGILGGLLHSAYKTHRETFPYTSLREWLHSLEWPAAQHYIYLGDYPEDSNPGWTNNIQGVAHDNMHWFFTQDERLWKIPVGHDLDEDIDEGDFPSAPIPAPFSEVDNPHMGDPDHYSGFIYLPFEGTEPAHIMMFRASSLEYIGSAPLTAQGNSAPWCAINPWNGLLYSSPFHSDHLCVYKRSVIANNAQGVVGLELEHLYNFSLFEGQGPSFLGRIQGGTFSPSGHLYLVSDMDQGGVLGYDMTTGTKIFQRTKKSLPTDVEMEGITIWDLDSGTAPHVAGQIHVVWLQDEAIVDDDIYFSHFRVTLGGKDKI